MNGIDRQGCLSSKRHEAKANGKRQCKLCRRMGVSCGNSTDIRIARIRKSEE